MLNDTTDSSESLKVKLNIQGTKRKADDELNENSDELLVSEAILQNLRKQKGNKLNRDTLHRLVFNSSSSNSSVSEELTIQNNEQFENALNFLISEDLVVDTGTYIKLKSTDILLVPESEDDLDIIGNKKYNTLATMSASMSDSDEDDDEVENAHIFIHNQTNHSFVSAPSSLLSSDLAPIPVKPVKYSKPWSDEMVSCYL
jgi:hypothetical protein